MIYTITLNPSVDYIMHFPTLNMGSVNRSNSEEKFAGGKGINVSRILKRLEVESIATGFLGGFTGEFIQNVLKEEKIVSQFISIQQDSRINVKVKSTQEADLNAAGPFIFPEEKEKLLALLDSLTSQDIVVLSGSMPNGLPKDFYLEIIKEILKKQARFVLDVSGEIFLKALEKKPFLVKPNQEELEEILQTSFSSKDEIVAAGKLLLEKGAKNVIISMGGSGAIYLNDKEVYFAQAIKGKVKNSVGAGDSMVAGFLSEIEKGNSTKEAFITAVASGTATAFSDDLASQEWIQKMRGKVVLEKLS